MVKKRKVYFDNPNFKNDALFKVIMTSPKTRKFAVGILNALTGIKKEYLENATYIGGEEINKKNINEKKQSTDVTVKVNDEQQIIVEMNQYKTDVIFPKNSMYVMSRIVENTNAGDTLYQKFILINIDNFNAFKTKKPLLTFLIRDEEGHIENELYKSIHLILENCINSSYNISKEIKKFAEFIYEKRKIEELESKYKGDEIYMAVVRTVKELSTDPEFSGYYDIEEKHRQELVDAKNTGIREGKEEGEKQAYISTAKKLLQLGVITAEQISEATGLTLEEIQKLKEE